MIAPLTNRRLVGIPQLLYAAGHANERIRYDSGHAAFDRGGDFALAATLAVGALESAIATAVPVVPGLVGAADARPAILVPRQDTLTAGQVRRFCDAGWDGRAVSVRPWYACGTPLRETRGVCLCLTGDRGRCQNAGEERPRLRAGRAEGLVDRDRWPPRR